MQYNIWKHNSRHETKRTNKDAGEANFSGRARYGKERKREVNLKKKKKKTGATTPARLTARILICKK